MASRPGPRITALVVTYNQKPFVAEALRSILNQADRDLEIVVSDDCSSDGTLAEVRRIADAADPGIRFAVTSTERNSGLAGNLNNAVTCSRGDILIACAGDDRSRLGRFSRLKEIFSEDERVFAIVTDTVQINGDGKDVGYESGWRSAESITLAMLAIPGASTLGATMAYRREVFDFFGPLPNGMNWEDHILPFRAALLGKVHWLAEPLVDYRVHGTNMSASFYDLRIISGRDFANHMKRICITYLNILYQKAKDIDSYLAVYPASSERHSSLQKQIADSIELCNAVALLFSKPWKSTFQGIALILKGKITLRFALKTFLMAKLPEVWLWHVRRTGSDLSPTWH